eukprot:m51a1_g7372 hypothetical protein (398) ;mRNA; r:70379-71676
MSSGSSAERVTVYAVAGQPAETLAAPAARSTASLFALVGGTARQRAESSPDPPTAYARLLPDHVAVPRAARDLAESRARSAEAQSLKQAVKLKAMYEAACESSSSSSRHAGARGRGAREAEERVGRLEAELARERAARAALQQRLAGLEQRHARLERAHAAEASRHAETRRALARVACEEEAGGSSAQQTPPDLCDRESDTQEPPQQPQQHEGPLQLQLQEPQTPQQQQQQEPQEPRQQQQQHEGPELSLQEEGPQQQELPRQQPLQEQEQEEEEEEEEEEDQQQEEPQQQQQQQHEGPQQLPLQEEGPQQQQQEPLRQQPLQVQEGPQQRQEQLQEGPEQLHQQQQRHQRRACAWCGAAADKVCGACRAARYCSVECQRLHWRLGHRDECGALGKR